MVAITPMSIHPSTLPASDLCCNRRIQAPYKEVAKDIPFAKGPRGLAFIGCVPPLRENAFHASALPL